MPRKNVMRCRHCYGLLLSIHSDDLIQCPCHKYLFCSQDCLDEVMNFHVVEFVYCLTSSTFRKNIRGMIRGVVIEVSMHLS